MKSELLNRLALAYARANKRDVVIDFPDGRKEPIADVLIEFGPSMVGTFEVSLHEVLGDFKVQKGSLEKRSRELISHDRMSNHLLEWAVDKLDPSARKQAEKGAKRGRPKLSPSVNGSVSPN